jgi:hypothetical protein
MVTCLGCNRLVCKYEVHGMKIRLSLVSALSSASLYSRQKNTPYRLVKRRILIETIIMGNLHSSSRQCLLSRALYVTRNCLPTVAMALGRTERGTTVTGSRLYGVTGNECDYLATKIRSAQTCLGHHWRNCQESLRDWRCRRHLKCWVPLQASEGPYFDTGELLRLRRNWLKRVSGPLQRARAPVQTGSNWHPTCMRCLNYN